MADPAGSGPGNAAKRPRGGCQPDKQRFYQNPWANRKISSEFQERPYLFAVSQLDPQNPFKCIVNKDKHTEHLPNGWKLYFHCDELAQLRPEVITKNLRQFTEFVQANPEKFDLACILRTTAFDVDAYDLEDSHWTTFSEDLQANPEHTLACVALAMHLQINESPALSALPRRHLLLLAPRINNVEWPVSSLKSPCIEDRGKFLRVRGNIIQACESTLEWLWRTLKCGTCDAQHVVLQKEGRLVLPDSCRSCGYRGREFVAEPGAHFNVVQRVQVLRLQEIRSLAATITAVRRNEAPVVLDLVVHGDLAGKLVPGTDVLCTGVLKARVEGERDQDRRFHMYLDVMQAQVNGESNERHFDHSADDYQVVQRMKREPNPLRLLVHSLCPKIIGQERVKAALLLGMFSLSPKEYTGTRKEAHVLLVGDPGLGKSELLEACADICPRGVFVSSNSVSSTGLTATLNTDSAQKSTVEAGALVMADQGVCCIDELDKITSSTDVLLDAMEDQVVNIAKAGVINKLRAKTCVLAAANPIGGHYNKARRITENLKIGLPVLSRFDLVLVLIDQKNSAVVDRFIKGARDTAGAHTQRAPTATDLEGRLRLHPEAPLEPLCPGSLQRYLSYVNGNLVPKLSLEAKAVIKAYYTKLRHQPFFSDIIPVTNRALSSLLRLTLARAKVDFCRVATQQHAEDVVELVEFGLRDVRSITEEDIAIHAQKQSKEPRVSKAKQMNNFTRILQIRARDAKLTTFTKAELRELAQRAEIRNANEIIELMNVNGVLLLKGGDTYQFVNY